MKKLLLIGGIVATMIATPLFASNESPVNQLNKKEAPSDYIIICSGVILSVDNSGTSGTMVISATGEEVTFFNPLGQYVRVGQTVSAQVTFCSIIDPPKRTGGKKKSSISSVDNTTSSTSGPIETPMIAILIAL